MALTSVWNSLKLDLRIALNVATMPDDLEPHPSEGRDGNALAPASTINVAYSHPA
jgi:hypothetical protein